jgi:hypothetical protein
MEQTTHHRVAWLGDSGGLTLGRCCRGWASVGETRTTRGARGWTVGGGGAECAKKIASFVAHPRFLDGDDFTLTDAIVHRVLDVIEASDDVSFTSGRGVGDFQLERSQLSLGRKRHQ